MAVGDAYVFPGFLTPVLTQLFFPKPPTTFLTCFCRGERRKYAGKKSRLNRGSNSQPPGHESDTLTTEPPGRGVDIENTYIVLPYISKEFGKFGEKIIIIISSNQVRYFLYTTALCTYSVYLSTSELLSFTISNTDKHEFSSIKKWIRCCNDVMNHVDCVIKRTVYPQKNAFMF